jgi:hypothetical protein
MGFQPGTNMACNRRSGTPSTKCPFYLYTVKKEHHPKNEIVQIHSYNI